MFAPWPTPFDDEFRGDYGLDDCYLEMVDAKYELVTQGRNLRREARIPAGKKVTYVFKSANGMSRLDAEVLRLLLNAESLQIAPAYEPKQGTPAIHSALGELYLPLEGLLDVEAEKTRLKKELEKYEVELSKVEQKLANPQFVQKVPQQVLLEHEKRRAEWQEKKERTLQSLQALG
jgi:valyl-tRNA synthetase